MDGQIERERERERERGVERERAIDRKNRQADEIDQVSSERLD